MDESSKKEEFLKAYAECAVLAPALKAVGATRADLREWRKDAEFESRLGESYEDAIDDAEFELRRRGVHGWEEPVLYKGEPVWRRDPDTGDLLLDDNFEPIPFTVRKHSDKLLEVYLRSHRTAYKERSEVAITGPQGGRVEQDITVRYVLPEGKAKGDYHDQQDIDPGF